MLLHRWPARQLEADLPAVRFTLDEWLLRLNDLRYDDPRYPALADSCKSLIWDTACQVMRAGVDVLLDWNQWSRARLHALDAAAVRHLASIFEEPAEDEGMRMQIIGD